MDYARRAYILLRFVGALEVDLVPDLFCTKDIEKFLDNLVPNEVHQTIKGMILINVPLWFPFIDELEIILSKGLPANICTLIERKDMEEK